MKPSALVAAALLLLGGAVATADTKAPRKLYKWTDDKGVVHYTETLPAEVAGRERTELDTRGRVRGRREAALTDEQRRQADAATAQRVLDDKAADEARRRDKALLNTYTSEAEIDKLRDRALVSPAQAIDNVQLRLAAAKRREADTRAKADALRGQGKAVPGVLVEDLNEQGRDIDRLAADLVARQQEMKHVQEKYELEKRRWRELRAAAPTAPTAPAASSGQAAPATRRP
ncbi:MAG: DUF4124 domain-containing protein [Burkholderiales bacterium]|jgi:hypothetical protein|nr:DUF4124 domain-containing protein [Burkholderiales bacterium]